jgi:hypothetical protein
LFIWITDNLEVIPGQKPHCGKCAMRFLLPRVKTFR